MEHSKSPLVTILHRLNSLFSFVNIPDKTYLVVVLIAFSQGVVGLSDLALNYLYKDDLHLMPPQVTRINSLIIIPWIIKPVYGLISDTLPICGYRRKPYLFIFGCVSIFCWYMMALYALLSFDFFPLYTYVL